MYLVVEEDSDDEGASGRGAWPLRKGDSDSMAFADGEGDRTQQGDRELAPQIHSCSPFLVLWRGPREDGEGRESGVGTWLGGTSP